MIWRIMQVSRGMGRGGEEGKNKEAESNNCWIIDQSYAELSSGICKISYLYAKLHYIFPDIDECSSNAHSCGVNAVCNNTVGSYACACKAGYSGDGRKCTGKAFWSFSKGDLEERDTVNDSCVNLFILEYRRKRFLVGQTTTKPTTETIIYFFENELT